MKRSTAERMIRDATTYFESGHEQIKRIFISTKTGNCCYIGACIKQNGYNRARPAGYQDWTDLVIEIYDEKHYSSFYNEIINITSKNDLGWSYQMINDYILNNLVTENE